MDLNADPGLPMAFLAEVKTDGARKSLLAKLTSACWIWMSTARSNDARSQLTFCALATSEKA